MSPDHNLITWCQGATKSDADCARLNALSAALQTETGYTEATHLALIAELDLWTVRAADAAWMLISLVAQAPAKTAEGMRAKAALLAAISDGPYLLDELARSVAADVMRFFPAREEVKSIDAEPASQMVH